MAGLSLNMGLNGQGAFGSGYGGAATPNAAGASPQASTIGQKAYGISTGGTGLSGVGPTALLSVGGLALIGLVYIWWSLPR